MATWDSHSEAQVSKNLPDSAGSLHSIPGVGEIPHAAEHLSPCTTIEACML